MGPIAMRRPTAPFAFGASVVLLQRFGLPIGELGFPLLAVTNLAFVTFLALSRVLQLDPLRSSLLCIFGGLGLASTIVNPSARLTSIGLVLATWIVVAYGPGDNERAARAQQEFLRGLTLAIAAGSIFGAVQLVSSSLLGFYPDPVTRLPPSLLLGGFNSSYPVTFGGDWLRANGFLFLEPSFLSLYCCVGLLILATTPNLFNRVSRLAIIMVLGLAASVAVSGAVVLPFIVIALVRSTRGALLAVAAAITLTLSNGRVGVVTLIWEKLTLNPFDTSGQVSAAARLYRPYTDLFDPVLSRPLLGHGPGSARDLVAGQAVEVTTPTLMKLLYEYGVLGAAFLTVAIAIAVLSSDLPRLLALGLLAALIIPTDGLTSPHLLAITLVPIVLAIRAPTDQPRHNSLSESHQPIGASA